MRFAAGSRASSGDRPTQENHSMLITPAYAQSIGGGSDFMIQLLPILLMFVIFYFLLLRPQQQRVKQHREMVANIRRGDTVVTAGGIVAKVTRVKDGEAEIEVEIAENTRVRLMRGTIAEVRVKGEPVKAA
jgi:preprotein translocase subunit YajC